MVKSIVSVSSKGQVVLPASVRRALDLQQGDRLELEFDDESGTITLEPVRSAADLSDRVSRYARRREPVLSVDEYYQAHRGA
ncbi:AbrB/MazE/SpoVT family DNA-binding domain-containing protein [Microlunatus speluncae]|uniref:AbrB/MazE/SpoVT family DNA-binding domain-containing protein n=1 Tax=Microlunatus speluncae TaxID=2594267 RepID=UPI001C2DC1BA|nr:AbrB/MazE/SpoVT family DNA-binding domain-containing protein [Microlunatus speluncae]